MSNVSNEAAEPAIDVYAEYQELRAHQPVSRDEDAPWRVARYDDVPEEYALPTIERYELTGRQILIYVGNLSHEHSLSFSYRLRAKFPLKAQTPASSVYDYYNPDVSGQALPQTLVVVP